MNAMSPAMLEMIRKNKAKYSGGFADRAKKLADGKNRLRILPVVIKAPMHVGDDAERFWLESGLHWIKAPGNPKPLAVVGNSLIFYGTLSPLESMIEQAIATASTDEDIKFYTDMKARKSVLINAINRTPGSADASEVPAVYEMTPTTWGKVLGLMAEYAEDHGNIFDPNIGMDITIERTGKGLNTEYTVLPCFDKKNLPVSKDSMSKAVDLAAFVEKEYFRAGDETKALTIIANSTGLTLPALGAPRAAAGLLTNTTMTTAASSQVIAAAAAQQAARVVEAAAERKREAQELNDLVAASSEHVEVEAPPTQPEEEDEEAALLAQMAALKAKKAAAAKSIVKAATPAKKVEAVVTADFDADLSLDDLAGALGDI